MKLEHFFPFYHCQLALYLSLSIYIHYNICIFQLLNSIWYRSKMQSKKFDDNWTDTHFALILHDDNGPEYTYDRVVLITSDSLPPHSLSKYLYVYKRNAHLNKCRFLFHTNVQCLGQNAKLICINQLRIVTFTNAINFHAPS